MRTFAGIALGLALLFVAFSVSAEKRVALVVGNGDYDAVSPLSNPENDARLMQRVLRQAGFDVALVSNASDRTLRKAVIDFGHRLEGADVGLFYYAGHGIQLDGANYLVPIDAKLSRKDYLEIEALNVNNVLKRMGAAGNRLNIVILDACRNNPFPAFSRAPSRGLAVTRAPSGTYIAYATRPGDVAVDGEGANSPFTAALARALPTAGASLEQVFKQVRADVRRRTEGEQIPWTSSSIEGEFYFHKAVAAPNRSAARERALQGELAEARRRLDEAQQKVRQAETSAASADKAARDKRIEEARSAARERALQAELAGARRRLDEAQKKVRQAETSAASADKAARDKRIEEARSAARERALQGELAEARRRLDEAQQKARQAETSAASGASADKAARDKRIEELQIALASAETRAERAQEDVERFKIMPRAPGGKTYVVEDLPAKVWQVGDVTDLRNAPGEAGRRIRKVAMLTKVTLTGRTKDGNWLRVRLPSGEEGFLPAWTVTDPNATTARALPGIRDGDPRRRYDGRWAGSFACPGYGSLASMNVKEGKVFFYLRRNNKSELGEGEIAFEDGFFSDPGDISVSGIRGTNNYSFSGAIGDEIRMNGNIGSNACTVLLFRSD